jgi:hypothetical protein
VYHLQLFSAVILGFIDGFVAGIKVMKLDRRQQQQCQFPHCSPKPAVPPDYPRRP